MTIDLLPPDADALGGQHGSGPARTGLAETDQERPGQGETGGATLALHPALGRRFDGDLERTLATLETFEAAIGEHAAVVASIAAASSPEAQAPPSAITIAAMAASGSRLEQLARELRLAAAALESSGHRYLQAIRVVGGRR